MTPLLLGLSLGACGSSSSADPAAADPADNRIDCRIGNAPQYERFCTIDYGESEAGRTLVVRKPDGGFRRFLVARDGRGVVAADGAEAAEVTIIADDRIEVTIGGDSFRLPATVRSR